ncbi:DUF3224 domain-containing protein [Nocardia sp. NPDC020380]|uniref:DUF3224 domain-containing protein n=1 Tax=Nocardia sp. NPDC020380 TaxID=3364309 RepID=UPI003791505D
MWEMIATAVRIADWNETPEQEFDDGSKITRAHVTLTEGTDELTAGTLDMTLFYRPDGTGAFSSLMRLTAEIAGRPGTFALSGTGGFNDVASLNLMNIIHSSGTGELAGISGHFESNSRRTDYPFMRMELRYQLP